MPLVPPTCPKCDGDMVEGFVTDNTYGSMNPSSWAEGTPKPSFWGGTKQPKTTLPITTYRCTNCGYLEAYAT